MAGANNELTDDDWSDFEQLLQENDDAFRLYIHYMEQSDLLRAVMDAMPDEDSASPDAICFEPRDSASPAPTFPAILPTSSSLFPSTLGYSAWTISYLSATVITGLLIFGFWLMPAFHPKQITRNAEPVIVGPKAYVGRITGMVDCKWNGGSRVSLGQKYELPSGLMEITYDTGAKVILQGPVRYSVEANGGYLAVGKLTGKLEKKASDPFAIRTPTATVTDLGTEFGVEVSRDGTTNTHVFAGEVQIVTGTDPGDTGRQTQVISAGQTARVAHNQAISVGKEVSAGIENRFARVMPASQRAATSDDYAKLVLSMNPAVYYRMEDWPKGKDEDTFVLVDSAPGAHHGVLHQDRSFGPRQRGRFGGALELHGSGFGDYAIVPDYPKAEDGQLSVSAWAQPWSLEANQWPAIVSNWWADPERKKETTGQFILGIGSERYLTARTYDRDGVLVCANDGARTFRCGVWHHVAFVADGAMLRLYHNGVEVAATPYRGIHRPARPKALGVGCQLPEPGLRPRTRVAGPVLRPA